MDFKPSEFSINGFDIFSIILPGSILPFLRLDEFRGIYAAITSTDSDNYQLNLDSWVGVALFFVVSYFIGHTSLQVSKPLEKIYFVTRYNLPQKIFCRFQCLRDIDFLKVFSDMRLHDKAKSYMNSNDLHTPEDLYHWAYSYIRLHNLAALSALERNSSHYSLFRSLTLIFAVNAVWSHFSGPIQGLLIFSMLSFFCFGIYWATKDWTYSLAFEYFCILKEEKDQAPRCVWKED